MVTQIKFEKEDPSMGHVKGVVRIKGKKLYFKFNDSDHANAMMAKLQSGGAIITSGRGWIRVNIFGNNDLVKLGGREFNPKELSDEQVELILTEYYQVQYARVGFKLNTSKIQ